MNTQGETKQNEETAELLGLWNRVSKKLRRKIEHEKEQPLRQAALLAGELEVYWQEPEERKELLGENYDNFAGSFLDEVGAAGLRAILIIHPAPKEIIARYEKNAKLDGLAKKTWARWEKLGDWPLQEAAPIPSEIAVIEKEMDPLLNELTDWARGNRDAIVERMQRIFATERRPAILWETICQRKTPKMETYLTKSQMLALRPEMEIFAQEDKLNEEQDETLERAMESFRKKLRKLGPILKEQGLNPHDVILDAMNYDCREEIFTERARKAMEDWSRMKATLGDPQTREWPIMITVAWARKASGDARVFNTLANGIGMGETATTRSFSHIDFSTPPKLMGANPENLQEIIYEVKAKTGDKLSVIYSRKNPPTIRLQ